VIILPIVPSTGAILAPPLFPFPAGPWRRVDATFLWAESIWSARLNRGIPPVSPSSVSTCRVSSIFSSISTAAIASGLFSVGGLVFLGISLISMAGSGLDGGWCFAGADDFHAWRISAHFFAI